jgi:glycine/D-amino acid oxidase-like deaminating enzyme
MRAPAHLATDCETGVSIVGGGIAGLSTAFFALRDTDEEITLLEAERVANGASGYNAGQMVTYFERPLGALVDAFGFEPALDAQRAIDGAWSLFDEMQREAAPHLSVGRVIGHMGMWSDNHLAVHLRNNRLRQQGGLALEPCLVSDRVRLGTLEREYGDLFQVVPQARIAELLETRHERYRAVLSFPKGTANSAVLCEQIAVYLLSKYPDRFRLYEGGRVEHIELDVKGATLRVGSVRVRAGRVVLCTNGYQDHTVENRAGPAVDTVQQQQVQRTIGFMAGYCEAEERGAAAISYLASPRIGEGQAYYYFTRRPFACRDRRGSLVCIGGPDLDLAWGARYDPRRPLGSRVLNQLDDFIRPILAPEREGPLPYRWTWHGLMGYTRGGVRVIGAEPRNPVLLYNFGCNGVGLLPSVYGGWRTARLLAGKAVAASIFDPA